MLFGVGLLEALAVSLLQIPAILLIVDDCFFFFNCCYYYLNVQGGTVGRGCVNQWQLLPFFFSHLESWEISEINKLVVEK